MTPSTRGKRALEAGTKDPPTNKLSAIKQCFLAESTSPNQSAKAETPKPAAPVREEDDVVDTVIVDSSPEKNPKRKGVEVYDDSGNNGEGDTGGKDVKKPAPKKNNRKQQDNKSTDGGSKKSQDVKRHMATKKHKRDEDDSDHADCVTKEGKECRETIASLAGLSGPAARHLGSLIATLAEERQELDEAKELADFRQDEAKTVQNLLDNEKHKNSDLATQLQKLKSQVKGLQTRGKNLLQENKQLEKAAEHSRKKLSEALAELKPDYGDPNKVTDDMIADIWQNMQYLVHSAVDLRLRYDVQSATGPSIKSHLDVSSSPAAIVAVCEDCKQDPVCAHFRVQRYIWRRLFEDIFQAKNGIWGGNMGESFVETIGRMQDLCEDDPLKLSLVSRMKYKIGKDIDMVIGRNQEAITKVIDKLCADLSVFCKPGEGQKLREAISGLCDKAVSLMIMTRSRAIFTVYVDARGRSDGSLPFDPASMELKFSRSSAPAEASTVDFFVTPPVAKIGTADGGKFDQKIFVCKGAVVVCHQRDVEVVDEGFQTASEF